MNKYFFLLLLLSFGLIADCAAQKKMKRPGGTVAIDDKTFMAATEVTVEDWMGFIASNDFDASLFPDESLLGSTLKILFEDLKQKLNAKYLAIVDHNSSQKGKPGNKSVIANNNVKALINKEKAFVSLRVPVTGISFQQVLLFCKWKEALLNQSSETDQQIKISLPSIEMYATLITNIDSVCNECDSCTKYKFNYTIPKASVINCSTINSMQGQVLLRIDAYWPTKLGLYCLQGNAAEMTSTEGIAMGGSFKHTARQSYSDQKQQYSKPESWLGFRYVVTSY